MASIVLVAINARYIHPPFGLYCLRAALGPWWDQSQILEYTLKSSVEEMAQQIAEQKPSVIGLSVYLWNRPQFEALVPRLRSLCPHAFLVGGGPELEGLGGDERLPRSLDRVIKGPGEIPFRRLCDERLGPADPRLDVRRSCYDEYSDYDLSHRLTYVEASRGCAFTCSFCTSANSPRVEAFPIDECLTEWQKLLDRGATKLKFLDRTFNLQPARTLRFLDWFLERLAERPFFVHFEMVPDRFPTELRQRLVRFPEGSLQLEIGVQTLNPMVSKAIHRSLDPQLVLDNLRFLTEETTATVHADLIAGLPGETLEDFGQGFDRLWNVLKGRPGNEVQLGILKRLPGTPLDRDPEPGARFRPEPPYDLVESPGFRSDDLDRLGHAARVWERAVNRGRMPVEALVLSNDQGNSFQRLMDFTQYYLDRHGVSWGVAEQVLRQDLIDFGQKNQP